MDTIIEYRIITYKTVEGENPAHLDRQIKDLIGEGYQPYGNPYTANKQVCQAMIKTNTAPRRALGAVFSYQSNSGANTFSLAAKWCFPPAIPAKEYVS